MAKIPLGRLYPLPSAYTTGALFTHPGGSADLSVRYEREGSLFSRTLKFTGVRAYRFRAQGHCELWHIADAYDTLVEVTPSDWVDELLAAEPSETWGRWAIRHFLIFVAESGAYEVAAEGVEWQPEQPVG
jgi:hypothetical protein